MKKEPRVVILFYSIFVYAVNFGNPSPDTGEGDAGNITGTFGTSSGNFTNTRSDDNIYFAVGRGVGDSASAT